MAATAFAITGAMGAEREEACWMVFLDCAVEIISTVSTDVVELRGPPILIMANQIAFLMGMHPRLGQDSPLLSFASAPTEVAQIIVSRGAETKMVYTIQSVVKKERTLESLHIEWYGSCHRLDEEQDEWVTDRDHCGGRPLTETEEEIVVCKDECYCLNLKAGVAEARSIIERLVAKHNKSTEQGKIVRRAWPGEKKYAQGAVFVYRPRTSTVKQAGHILESITVTVTPTHVQ